MKIILLQTVPKLGKEGQVVTVKDGYARNFLFPKKLALLADRSQIKALEKRNERLTAKLAETKAAAESTKTKLDGTNIRIEGKVGRDATKLFGAITAQDIADAIKAQAGIEIDKKQVGILQAIKALGTFNIDIDLHRDVDAHITVEVFDPAAPVVAPVVEEAAEAVDADDAELVEA
jgi:large subunit ribosomal protein L9